MKARVEIRVNGNLEVDTYTNVENIYRLVTTYLGWYVNAVITIRQS